MSKQANPTDAIGRLANLIDYYAICNKAEGKSPKTISWYTANLKRFRIYLISRHIPERIDSIDTKLLREYILYLMKEKKFNGHPFTPSQSEPLSGSTIHGHFRTLRAFFGWLLAEGLIDSNPASRLRPPKVTRKVVSTLSDQEIKTILHLFNPVNPCDSRNQTIFMILLDTGLRIGEIISLKTENSHLNEGFLKVLGKGNRERVVPIGSSAQRAIQRYLFRYRPQPIHQGISNVFLSIHGKQLTENSMKLMFTRLAKESGVHRLHAHLCRHTFATRFLINGGDVFSLQQILGHSTLEMVKLYVNLASSHVAIQHQKFSPLDRLNLRGV
jgi:integrase/recombinase XerC/integrase/recombinase XerD